MVDPIKIKDVRPYGAMELENNVSKEFWIVNDRRLKTHLSGEMDKNTTNISLR